VHPELEYDSQGNLVGSGLTLVPTTHQFQIEQQTLFAWCAFDTLTYPVELHVSARITSQCPVTGKTIRLIVTPEQVRDLDPPNAQVSLVVEVTAACCSQNVREDVCKYGHFFASPEAVARWQAMHPQVLILSVAEAYQVGKLVGDLCTGPNDEGR
jgi:alkylmercury lyase